MPLLILAFVFLAFPSDASAWGNHGHQAVAEAAQATLEATTELAIAKILGHGNSLAPGTLARLSTWPDDIRTFLDHGRPGPGWDATDKHEALLFNRHHKQNRLWHFVNLPLKSVAYPDLTQVSPDDPVLSFTRPDDIVHMIKVCIDLLEAETESETFTRAQALRWLVHLVGDIHQPLHVTSGYYSAGTDLSHPKLISEPVEALTPGVVDDRGGNGLLFSPTKENNLYALWDSCLVELVGGASSCGRTPRDYHVLSGKLVARIKEGQGARFKTLGDPHRWAEQWATDSLQVAVSAKVYIMSLRGGVLQTSPRGDPYLESIISAPMTKKQYSASHLVPALDQLTKAAVRLADLLNRINWK